MHNLQTNVKYCTQDWEINYSTVLLLKTEHARQNGQNLGGEEKFKVWDTVRMSVNVTFKLIATPATQL